MSGMTRPMTPVRPARRLRALLTGTYPSRATTSRTLMAVPGLTGRLPDSACDTVAMLTPASRATSVIVTGSRGIVLDRASPREVDELGRDGVSVGQDLCEVVREEPSIRDDEVAVDEDAVHVARGPYGVEQGGPRIVDGSAVDPGQVDEHDVGAPAHLEGAGHVAEPRQRGAASGADAQRLGDREGHDVVRLLLGAERDPLHGLEDVEGVVAGGTVGAGADRDPGVQQASDRGDRVERVLEVALGARGHARPIAVPGEDLDVGRPDPAPVRYDRACVEDRLEEHT